MLCLMCSRERDFVCRKYVGGSDLGMYILGLWPERGAERDSSVYLEGSQFTVAQIEDQCRRSPLVTPFIFLWFKDTCWFLFSHLTSQMPKGVQSGEGSVQAQRRAWKANLLNRKIFIKINTFDYVKSKTCTQQNHTNQIKVQTGNHIYSFYDRQNINNHLNKAFTNQLTKDKPQQKSIIVHKRINTKRPGWQFLMNGRDVRVPVRPPGRQ